MAYFNAGAWWTSSGQAYASEAEAKAAEGNAPGTGSSSDEFARAMGTPALKPVAAPASAVAGPTVAQAQQQQTQVNQAATGAQTAINNAGYLNDRAKDQSGGLYIGDDARQKDLADQRAGVTGREYRTTAEQAQWEQTHQRSFAGNLARDPVTAGILAAPYGVLGAGAAIGGAAGLGLADAAAVGGSVGGVPAGTPFAMASPFGPGSLAAGAATGAAASQGLSLAQKAALGIGALGVVGGLSTTDPKTGQAGTATPPPLNAPAAPNFSGLQALTSPGTPGMTPAQMLQGVQGQNIGGGYQAPASLQNAQVATQQSPTRQAAQTALGNTFDMSASGGTPAGGAIPVRPSSAQQDSIVQQMLAQANAAPLPYNAATAGTSSAGTAQGYGATAGTAQGFDATAGTSIAGLSQAAQAALVQAETGQRNQSRDDARDIARLLAQAAEKEIGPIKADQTVYNQTKTKEQSIIDQLIAAAQMPDGPSAAEALALNMQERATRNALGNAASMGGGWRSQLTNQRRALGDATATQADITAQIAALRAQEYASNRDRQVTGLSNAGGLEGGIAGRDQNFAINDQNVASVIAQANQTNRREALGASGNVDLGMLNSDTAFSTANADRDAQTNIANAGFTTQSNISNAQNQTQSSIANASFQTQASIASAGNRTSASQTNANNQTAASIATANNQTSASQTNANNQTASSINNANNATQTSIANANNRTVVDQNNRSNALTSLQNAGVLASNTRQQDMSLSIAQANNLTSAAIANANLQGSVFATQMQAAIAQQDAALKQQQINNLQTQIANANKGVKIGGVSVSQNSLSALQQTLGIISLM